VTSSSVYFNFVSCKICWCLTFFIFRVLGLCIFIYGETAVSMYLYINWNSCIYEALYKVILLYVWTAYADCQWELGFCCHLCIYLWHKIRHIKLLLLLLLTPYLTLTCRKYTRDNKSVQNFRRKNYLDLAAGNVLENNHNKLLNIPEGQDSVKGLDKILLKPVLNNLELANILFSK
jgi:hypothetical protein